MGGTHDGGAETAALQQQLAAVRVELEQAQKVRRRRSQRLRQIAKLRTELACSEASLGSHRPAALCGTRQA